MSDYLHHACGPVMMYNPALPNRQQYQNVGVVHSYTSCRLAVAHMQTRRGKLQQAVVCYHLKPDRIYCGLCVNMALAGEP